MLAVAKSQSGHVKAFLVMCLAQCRLQEVRERNSNLHSRHVNMAGASRFSDNFFSGKASSLWNVSLQMPQVNKSIDREFPEKTKTKKNIQILLEHGNELMGCNTHTCDGLMSTEERY
ncbi:hypothetical protein E2C01_007048 [Portunus trituberculatus]|uniref:Uncharacterized protein n=1 Tax=Portunus trituberculatus TaxID=210409 RepID=A0A5B7CZT9_PORTR|nr:hypothetical protein [Portunus trituberculatus]